MAKSKTTTTQSTGTSIVGLLGIAFIVLKLTGVITWSWLWVLAPFWIPLGIVVLILLGFGVAILLASLGGKKGRRA